MKIKNFICSIPIIVVIAGLATAVVTSLPNSKEVSMQIDQAQIHIPNRYQAASTSKGTILMLLAVGVIGVLGISRKKKNIGSPAQRSDTSIGRDHQNFNKDKKKNIV